MSTNQMYAVGWLVRRLEWECTLAELHARARPGAEQDLDPPPGGVPMPSPDRGMSRRARGSKIRT